MLSLNTYEIMRNLLTVPQAASVFRSKNLVSLYWRRKRAHVETNGLRAVSILGRRTGRSKEGACAVADNQFGVAGRITNQYCGISSQQQQFLVIDLLWQVAGGIRANQLRLHSGSTN